MVYRDVILYAFEKWLKVFSLGCRHALYGYLLRYSCRGDRKVLVDWNRMCSLLGDLEGCIDGVLVCNRIAC